MDAIKIKDLEKNYNNFSLTIEDLAVKSGYITGFIGPNGSGKTTTIRSILGLNKNINGTISVLGADISKDFNSKKDMAYVGDISGFLEESLISNIHKVVSSFYSNWDESLYKSYVKQFNIDESKQYKNLSKGKKKQFELIMALSHHPKLLLMDEPTSNLDPLVRNEFLELIQSHMEKDEMTVFYSTHITSDLDKAADYIVMIYNGKILLNAEKDELLQTHTIVKGKKDLLDNSIKKELIGIKENAFGFEGLSTDKNKAFDIFGNEAIYEKCTLEDLLLYYTRG
ncbi:ABC transporter ATP-binding protein [Clostridium sp.]|uniref:ABC transporter ATP-binding protein n=1 Tax=Clostridium sp. TaxID=1506 RepID=UPI003F3DE4B7